MVRFIVVILACHIHHGGRAVTATTHVHRRQIVERLVDIEVSCEINTVSLTSKQSQTNSDGSTRTRTRQSGGVGCLTCPWQSRDVASVDRHWISLLARRVGAPYGRFQAIIWLVFDHPTCPHLPDELPGTSQLKCIPWVSLLHGGHSWKWQRPFKDKPHDDDDDDIHHVVLQLLHKQKMKQQQHIWCSNSKLVKMLNGHFSCRSLTTFWHS